MNRLNISVFTTSYSRLCLALFILIICTNTHGVFANDGHNEESWMNDDQEKVYVLKRDIPNDVRLTRRGVWSRLFRQEYNPTRGNNHVYYSPTASVHLGAIHVIPFDKRTIPIELQKALFAHGIIGRRRR
ncbi:unnamed protein product [Adineta ricciae]|uniref:Uncharacterized protein n=1 Tax=Adineta ricciae TaxID=249248 RepID=A0A813WVB9_ADIRI|nr:unnamed protein product [Adineta ricciae]